MTRNKIKRDKKKRKIDLLGLVLIAMLLIMFISIFTHEYDSGRAASLEKEAEVITNKLTDDKEYSFAPNNAIHEERLEQILEMGYITLKNTLDAKNEFCIYFEDADGNLFELEDGIKSIGSSAIKINGEPCGK